MNQIVGFVFAALIGCLLGAQAQPAEPMKIRLDADPRGEVRSILLADDFGENELGNKVPVLIDINPETVERRNSVLSIAWSDGTQTSFPILISKVFGGKTVEFYFRKDDPSRSAGSDLAHQCRDVVPPTIRGMFQRLYHCRQIAMRHEYERNRYAVAHLRALAGWFDANLALYTRSKPLGPYGVDPLLLQRIREIIAMIDARTYRDDQFQPLRVSDVRDLIKLVNEEDIRLAGFVPILIGQGRLADAKDLNSFVRVRFDEIVKSLGVSSIHGVNGPLLQANDEYIRSLRRGS